MPYSGYSQFIVRNRPVTQDDLENAADSADSSAGAEKFSERSSRQRQRRQQAAQSRPAPGRNYGYSRPFPDLSGNE